MKGCCQRFKKAICCDDSAKFPTPYQFNFNGADKTPQNQDLFQSNYVRTSKYTVVSFFPKALILQFKRLANVYFLIIAILQTIPQISPLSPATAWAPFIVVLAISLLREGYEDYQRIRSDHETNYGTMTHVMRGGKFQEVNWSQVVVGDMVRTENEEMFPADLILITSAAKGAAFIETASLDGEKNLKPKNSFTDLIQYDTEQKLSKLKGVFSGNAPSLDLKQFSGTMDFQSIGKKIEITDNKQFMYRGTRLKNTKWIYGLAVQTGKNTKIMMNSRSDAQKMSQVQIKVNYILVGILVIQIILSIVVAIGYSIFRRQNESSFNYINWPTQYNVALDSVLIFFAQFVLINTMIPISLIVSIEIVKFFQMIFIEKDKLMYSDYRKRGVTVKSASLNQELGQIQYIFSDKTGTVTMNIMEFKSAVIGDQVYGVKEYAGNNVNIKVPDDGNKLFVDDELKRLLETGAGDAPLSQPLVIHDLEGKNQVKFNTKRELAAEYIKILATAHDVLTDVNKKGQKVFLGQSPDQITLVEGARQMGYEFMRSTQSQTIVQVFKKQTSFERLELFEFNSDRKRMSVIIRENGKLKMYMKGADSIVEKRTAADSKLNIKQFLTNFSNRGLRTLLIAMKTVSQQQYNQFKADRTKTSGMSADQQRKAIDALKDKLQQGMYIIGATAVLDRLQDEVPQTIRDLIRANIKVWMLTGDKMETAYNIANSCRLFTPEFEILRYKPKEGIKQDQIIASLRQLVQKTQTLTAEGTPKGLLIQGGDLKAIIASQQASIQLANLAKDCEAVVCCRLEPIQKAQVVRLVRKHLNKITLAIGDGSNDVPMIKEAHIGVGLYGEQGMGAVQASDYALPQFRMLWRLLLVHGRWNYIRISQMILYFFYKNMLFTLPQFYIAFYCGFSSQTIFDDWYVALFNLAFTSIPLIIRAVFEQDVNYIHKLDHRNADYQMVPTIKTLVKQQQKLPDKFKTNKYLYRLFPKIYFIGQENCIFNMKNYIAWMIEALIESLIIFFFTLYIISQLSVNSTGINSDYWLVSLTIYSTVIVVVTFKLATHTKFWSAILVISILVTTIGFYILHMWLTNFALTDYVYGTTKVAWTSLETYFVVLLCVSIVLFVDGIIVFVDFNRGGYTSRMRQVIKEEKMNNREYYDAYSLTITDNVTTASQNAIRVPRRMVAQ